MKNLIKVKFDDYGRLIQLCNVLVGNDGILDIVECMVDVKQRYGYHPKKWKLNIKLKRYFERKTGEYIYDLVEKYTYSP